MHLKNAPIGVFDSGMGGLTVLRELRKTLPNESFIYLGDTARLPYGTKSTNTVELYSVQMARILVERQVKALVIACNTATIAALSHLQEILPDIPVIGVVEPGAKAACKVTLNQKIAVLSTETTAASNAYQKAIHNIIPQARVTTRACGLLVALAEEGMADNAIAHVTFDHYLESLKDEDTLLLGCTHFPVFTSLLRKRLPASVSIVDSARATAIAVKSMLVEKGILNTNLISQATVHYMVTDSVNRFKNVGEIFLGEPLNASYIDLIDV